VEEAILERLRVINSIAKVRLDSMPNYNIYRSICAQLDYLYGIASGVEKDRSKLRDIIVGIYGVREFEESDSELSVALRDAQYIADKIAKGLKVSVHDLKR